MCMWVHTHTHTSPWISEKQNTSYLELLTVFGKVLSNYSNFSHTNNKSKNERDLFPIWISIVLGKGQNWTFSVELIRNWWFEKEKQETRVRVWVICLNTSILFKSNMCISDLKNPQSACMGAYVKAYSCVYFEVHSQKIDMFGKTRTSESRNQPVSEVLPQYKEQRAIPDAILGTQGFFLHNCGL